MILETERLILRPWTEKDAKDLYELAKDPEIGPAAGWRPLESKKQASLVIGSWAQKKERYAVCLKESMKPVGCIVLKTGGDTDMTEREDECEMGFWTGKNYWGNGYIPEAAREIIRHAFCDLKMRTVWCGYYDGNVKSKRAQEKIGFKYHHTCDDVPVPSLNEIRTGHTNVMTREDWISSFEIRKLGKEEISAALDLAWRVFSEYESPVYSKEGTEEFRRCLHDEEYLSGIEYYGCFDRRKLIGEIGIRPGRGHICFFFTDGKYHRLGIGTKLFKFLLTDFQGEKITLNSSPYGLPFYNFLGFVPADEEQTVNGIRFTPMVYNR